MSIRSGTTPAPHHCSDEGGGGKAWAAQIESIQGDRIDRSEAWVTIATSEGDQLTTDQARALASELVRAANAIDQG